MEIMEEFFFLCNTKKIKKNRKKEIPGWVFAPVFPGHQSGTSSETVVAAATKNPIKNTTAIATATAIAYSDAIATATLWSGTNKNRDVSTGPLARPFDRSLAPLTRSLAPDCSLCSHPPLRPLVRSLAHFAHSLALGYLFCVFFYSGP